MAKRTKSSRADRRGRRSGLIAVAHQPPNAGDRGRDAGGADATGADAGDPDAAADGGRRSRFSRAGPPRRSHPRLPETAIVQVIGTDADGDALARLEEWDKAAGRPPAILMHPEPAGRPALAPGERVLARLKPTGPGRYEGRTLRRLGETPGRILGIYRPGRGENRVVPTDRRSKAEWIIPTGQDAGAEADEIVLAEPLAQPARLGLRPARIIERLGRLGDARSISLIAIHTHDIPEAFPPEAVAEAERARSVRLGKRTDLRGTGLITIDGADARDFDDAVYAEPDPDRRGGFRLLVAIADVAHYVRSGSILDQAARSRGNSVYFPDRVVPMLPEALSNGLCSLRPGEDRGCLFVEMWIDAMGEKHAHRFGRGLMRSAARTTYEEIQAAHDRGDDLGLGLSHLYAAFDALLQARRRRGTLELDLPERKVVLDDQGHVASVAPRPRLDSHRLIEEFMVLANVAAAEELERAHAPCMYRVHAPPSDEKIDTLRGFLGTLGISLPPGREIHPRDLDKVLRHVVDTPEATLVNEVMLRSQSQAAYSPDNIGHFGLALSRYAHFTSPIRRYADLVVHRSLVKALQLGRDGLTAEQAADLPAIADHITGTERRAQLAERDAVDRYLAAFMAEQVGARFSGRISGVTRFGLFVTVTETGASGIVPMASLPDDFWHYDEREQTLTGRRTHVVFRLAQDVDVLLSEANPVTGGLVFHILQGIPQGRSRTAPRHPHPAASSTRAAGQSAGDSQAERSAPDAPTAFRVREDGPRGRNHAKRAGKHAGKRPRRR